MNNQKIIIVGGGFAGLAFLYKVIKEIPSKNLDITLIDKRNTSLEKPSLPEVALIGKDVEKVKIPLKPIMERKGVKFINLEVNQIDPDKQLVILNDNTKLSYDYLIIATGAVKDYDATPGFREYAYSVCDDEQAVKLHKKLLEFSGGNIVIGSAKTDWGTHQNIKTLAAPCEGPIGEVMFILDYELRQRNLRDKSNITVFSPGKIFFEDVGPQVHNDMDPLFKECDFNIVTSKILRSIEKDKVVFEDGTFLPSDLTIAIPKYIASPMIKNSDLGDKMGFILTDDQMRHTKYKNIFAVGDTNVKAMPKLGHIAIMQAHIAASAFIKELTGKGEVPQFSPEVFCIMNQGEKAILILSNYLFGGNVDLTFKGSIAHMMKWSFDEYYYFTKGHMPPEMTQEGLEMFLKDFINKR
ncbi:Sulfide:quinone oxidoreductase SqrE [Ignavibacterium album JCM 16511]|uniref:Sulfide:quinone oxidoreductase SqrE n=1 Tax=Ignavibacterium album (strain DSM 19864 / JCM 16511 / NBRC 101810 / Mat9-16) TaxID=945713 RepID=I0AFX7_IGNAJ|nr:FAD-dependent oxidoreductase [Ignavibacterium album]AFH47884.1 Sulfide:quinone oxidoreductase SqrE [Ignavibacterium album JCM 16511]